MRLGKKEISAVRLLVSGLVGCAVTSLPWLASKTNEEGLWLVDILLMPGMIVGLVLSRRVHDISFSVVLFVSAVFYSWIAYLCLRAYHKW
jgi:hypothetical protein